MEVNISTKLTFGNILIGYLRQVGCFIEVTANTGLTVFKIDGFFAHFHVFIEQPSYISYKGCSSKVKAIAVFY